MNWDKFKRDWKNNSKENLNRAIRSRREKHPFHIVAASPWPFFTAQTLTVFVLALVSFLYFVKYSEYLVVLTFLVFLTPVCLWFRDVIFESTFMGHYTVAVQRGLRIGMCLFIVSEAMLFFSFFWSFLHFSLCPSIWIGSMWPPFGIETIDWKGLPLFNTIVLVSSGVTVTFAHRALSGDASRRDVAAGMAFTILLGVLFILCQRYEFVHAPFSINDSVYGSIFFLITGFHGLHVIIGTIFLAVNYARLKLDHFLTETHLGFEFAIWYWHFVDVIWILVFLLLYYWGGK